MNALARPTADPASGASEAPQPQLHTLRRTGRKAVRFTGWQIIEACGSAEQHGDAGTVRYDLALYRSMADAVIVELIARRKHQGEQDTHRVEVFAGLDDAVCWLEAYDCAADVPIPLFLAANTTPVAICVLQAVQLRQSLLRIREDYQDLLSDLFEALDITDLEPVPAGKLC